VNLQPAIGTLTTVRRNTQPIARRLFRILLALGLSGCASNLTVNSPVRRVDVSQTPDLKPLAAPARQIGNEFYPKVCALLADEGFRPPDQFDIIFQILRGDVAVTASHRIYVNADWIRQESTQPGWTADTSGDLAKVLVHEMAHVAQQHKRHKGPSRYWTEGMADYVRYQLGLTNGWNCPECSGAYPHYSSGYCCAGAFLLHLDALYGTNLVRRLNAELRRGSYSEEFFSKNTGTNLETLWSEFQKTSAFKPEATTAYKVQQSLGFVNGKPPKDIDARWQSYVREQPGGALTLEGWQFLENLRKRGRLPGFQKSERLCRYQGEFGNLSYQIPRNVDPANYPAWREFHFHKASSDPSIYRYLIVRAAKEGGWKLRKAWRSANGRDEEFTVQ
jgi:hypothetical protein